MTTVQIRIAAIAVLVIALFSAGCIQPGKVEQGRVISYDKKAALVTLVPESRAPGEKGKYIPPAITVQTPENADEMGPQPTPGKLMFVDVKKHELAYYDSAAQSLHTLAYTPVVEKENVKAPAKTGVDREKKTITIYSRTMKRLVVLVATDEMLALPADCFKYGDIVRYYYKDPARALRFMNVSRTDLASSK